MKNNETIKISFEIPLESYRLLKSMELPDGNYKQLEYKDSYKFESLNDYLNSEEFSKDLSTRPRYQSSSLIKDFKSRNENGTFYLVNNLLDKYLLKEVDAWYRTFVLTDFGKYVISKESERERNLEQLLED